MIILITGKPGVGKSTALAHFTEIYTGPTTWIVTEAILGPEGGRLGFAATNSTGETRTISHKTGIKSDVVVGVNHVDISAVDAMFAHALEGASSAGGALTVVDEIGPIQLLSSEFTAALQNTFAHDADLLASIHYGEERLAEYRESPKAILLQVTPENRDILPQALVAMATHRAAFNELASAQKSAAARLIHEYVAAAHLLQVQKLMQNAVYYVTEKKAQRTGPNSWTLAGRHGEYLVQQHDGHFACTCDLFSGKGKYQGNAGECSHVQTVKISYFPAR